MQGHHTREQTKTTGATERRLLQAFKRDKELNAALGVLERKLGIPEQETVVRICYG
ncbi:helicase [Vibrio fluvialis]|uniref:helicase n=1 Tax=Vibrio fluvialis TaxID=676 RepID=UPI001C9C0775|nr:helicase [Vibrio fluvialis]EKO3563520.1 helicase [Vibrio fluvialis]MBY7824326.1 helicase [Vibrio fluvialis]MBY7824334.1 helicase [Vibrio fluvialis]MCE7600102.1 helicase [Vibrio fluvialis]MCE7658436.1 helicase [Vibrio fluvialis]